MEKRPNLTLVQSDTKPAGDLFTPDPSNKRGGGDGGDGLDARIHALEEMVGKVALDLAEIKGKISMLPTTVQLFAAVLTCTALAAALVFGAIKAVTP